MRCPSYKKKSTCHVFTEDSNSKYINTLFIHLGKHIGSYLPNLRSSGSAKSMSCSGFKPVSLTPELKSKCGQMCSYYSKEFNLKEERKLTHKCDQLKEAYGEVCSLFQHMSQLSYQHLGGANFLRWEIEV